MDDFLKWFGLTIIGGVIIWMMTFGVLLCIEVGSHRVATFNLSAGHHNNLWWLFPAILLTLGWGFASAIMVSEGTV